MPTYQYACTEADCGHVFEQFQSFTDDSLTVCPQCEGRLRKVFNAVGVVFKGSGFYRTDSRSDTGSGDKAKADSATPSTTGAGATSGSGSDAGSGSGATGSTGSTSSSGGSSSSTSSTATAGAGAA